MANKAGNSAKDGAANGAGAPTEEKGSYPRNAPTREDRAHLRLSHIAKIRAAMDDRKAAQEAVKLKRKEEKKLRNAYEVDGFSLALLDEAFDRENTPGRDLQAYEVERHELFEDLGQPNYVQPDMFEEMADAEYWRAAGYRAGLSGREGKPPKECPADMHQAWMKGWGGGQERLSWALAEHTNPESKTGQAARGGPTAEEIKRQAEEPTIS